VAPWRAGYRIAYGRALAACVPLLLGRRPTARDLIAIPLRAVRVAGDGAGGLEPV